MKVRMVLGIYEEYDVRRPLTGVYLSPVAFPMTEIDHANEDPEAPDEIEIHDEEALELWARRTFGEGGYEIWDMEIPHEEPGPPKSGPPPVPGARSPRPAKE